MKTRILCAAFALAGLSGCSTTAEVIELSPGVYQTGGSNRLGAIITDADIRASDVKRARVFCNAKGQQPLVRSFDAGAPPTSLTPQNSTIVFSCQ